MTEYFQWNVHPEIAHFFGPFGLRWYSLFFLTGIVTSYYAFGRLLLREGKSLEIRENFLYWAVFGTVIGARLGHCLFYDPVYYFSNPVRILKVWEGGLASHGGYTGIIIAIYLFTRKYRDLSFFWLVDRSAIFAILAGSFIRIGNFFNSEIIGRVSEVPWAVVFQRVDSMPRHPTQLYEFAGYFTISGVLYMIYRHYEGKPAGGKLLGWAFTIAFSFRFLVEMLKENQVSYENDMLFNMGQLLSVPFVVLGIWLILGYQSNISWLQWAYQTGGGESQGAQAAAPAKESKRKKKR